MTYQLRYLRFGSSLKVKLSKPSTSRRRLLRTIMHLHSRPCVIHLTPVFRIITRPSKSGINCIMHKVLLTLIQGLPLQTRTFMMPKPQRSTAMTSTASLINLSYCVYITSSLDTIPTSLCTRLQGSVSARDPGHGGSFSTLRCNCIFRILCMLASVKCLLRYYPPSP